MSASSDAFAIAEQQLLVPTGLSVDLLAKCMGTMLSRGVTHGDFYLEHHRSESWSLEEGIVKSGSFSIEQGIGVRAIVGEQTAFAYSGDLGLASIERAAQTVAAIARSGQSRSVVVDAPSAPSALYAPEDPLASIPDEAKIGLLTRIERYARARDPRVTQVMANLGCEYVVMLVLRSDGGLAADVRPL
ncbi:MAG: PmbA/TldA family metallopeptidase, partial [Casimicrobiaceae bacterium]